MSLDFQTVRWPGNYMLVRALKIAESMKILVNPEKHFKHGLFNQICEDLSL